MKNVKYNIEEIEEHITKHRSKEYWDKVQETVYEYFDSIFDNKYLDEILKCQIKIKLNFNINIKDDPIAFVEKVNDKKYEINFGKRLLYLLDFNAEKLLKDVDFFQELKTTNENNEIRSILSKSFLQNWINFIILHEFFHISRGHFNTEKKFYYEHNIHTKSDDELLYEVDADKFAMQFLIKCFFEDLSTYVELTKLDDSIIFKNFITSFIKLFDIFFSLNDTKYVGLYPTHLARIAVALTSVCEIVVKDTSIPLEKTEIEELTNTIYFEFIESNQYYNITIGESYYVEGKKMFHNYQFFLKNHDFKNKQLLKSNS